MKKLSLLMAGVAIALAGCGDKDVAVAPEMIDQAVQETAAEVEVLVVESTSAESAVTATAQVTAEEVVEAATETVAVVQDGVTPEVAAVSVQTPEAVVVEIDLAQGKTIYSKNCFACHGSGAAGAPRLGDTENWAPRISQGMDIMAGHAIDGFKGTTGYMPPKGGFMALSDAEVTAAVAYMVSESE